MFVELEHETKMIVNVWDTVFGKAVEDDGAAVDVISLHSAFTRTFVHARLSLLTLQT